MNPFNRIFLYIQYLVASTVISLSFVISGALFVASIQYIFSSFSGSYNIANSIFMLMVVLALVMFGVGILSISLPVFLWLKRTIKHLWPSYDGSKRFYKQLRYYFGVFITLAIIIAFMAYMGTFNFSS